MIPISIFEELEKLEKDKILVIVEGEKDFVPIKKLGFENIIKICGKSLDVVVDEVISHNPSEVLILTDFDREGENTASYLTQYLLRYKIYVNRLMRNKFKSFKINKIEELNSITEFIWDDSNGKIGPIHHKILNRSRIQCRRNYRKTRCRRSYIWSDGRFVRSRFGFERITENR